MTHAWTRPPFAVEHILPPRDHRLLFGGCDYLGLSRHPAVLEALASALSAQGLSASASRTTTGNRPAHDALERRLATFTGFEAAVLLPEGYLANLALCQALAPTHRVALIDERAHRSLHDAATAAGMTPLRYRHLDAAHAAGLAAREYRPDLGIALLTDTVFTATGEIAPRPQILDALPPDALLLADDCHGLAVRGRSGRGTRDAFAISDPRLLATTTLAKGLGCYGGAVLGAADIASRVRTASAYVCTTPIPPAVALSAIAALDIMEHDAPRHERLAANARRLESVLVALGLAAPRDEPIPIFAIGPESGDLDALAVCLERHVIRAPLMQYPGGPAPRYIRLSVNADHTEADIDRLAAALSAWRHPRRASA